MPRRSAISLADIAEWDNLTAAFWRAAKGKRHRTEVARFAASLERELARLRAQILAATLPDEPMTSFEIRDPKPRTIHAPSFRSRVLHHALIHRIGPVLERSLVADSFACIRGRGTRAAVARAQHHTRRHPWFVKIDVAAYFASVEHDRLLVDLERRLRDRGVLELCRAVLAVHQSAPGRGLPIGALTSQQFANLYLGPLDRLLLEGLRVGGMVRYMDDTLWWTSSRERARAQLDEAVEFLAERRGLRVKPTWQINRSVHGATICGYRVYPYGLRLSSRRRRRYRKARARWERAHVRGDIDASMLQRGYESALAITAGADAAGFRRRELERRPPPEI